MKFYTYILIDPRNNQPFYVGKGKGRRMYEHKRIRSRLTNPLLKNKIYSILNSGFDIIYDKVLLNVDEESAYQKECELIEQYGCKINQTGILCNLTDGGEGARGSLITPEQRKAQSEYMKTQPRRLPIKCKPVSQYTLDGTFIQHWPSAKEASENTPANRSYITQVCKGKRKSAGSFLWSYKGDPIPSFSKKYYRPVQQLDLNNDLIATFQSLTEAQNQTGVELHNISECCRGKSKTAGGYIWRYI